MTEVALAAVLLLAGGLVLRSMVSLLGRDPGFRTHGLLTLRVSPGPRYDTPSAMTRFHEQVLERLRALPGVETAGATDYLPVAGTNNYGDFRIEGRAASERLFAGDVVISPGYLEALGIPVPRGRGIESNDGARNPAVVLIHRTAATDTRVSQPLNAAPNLSPCPTSRGMASRRFAAPAHQAGSAPLQ